MRCWWKTVSGTTITFNGLSNEEGTTTDTLPDSWVVGAIVEVIVPDSYVVTNDGPYSRITSDALEEIAPYVGMPVTLWYNSVDYQLFISEYIPHSEPPERMSLRHQSLWLTIAQQEQHLLVFLRDTYVFPFRMLEVNTKYSMSMLGQ